MASRLVPDESLRPCTAMVRFIAVKPFFSIHFTWLTCLFVALFTLAGTPANAEEKKEFTLHQVSLQVEDAMERFRNASIAGAVTTKQREGIEEAYKEYKKLYDAAVKTAGGKEAAQKTPAPENVRAAVQNVIDRVAAISTFP